MNAKQFFISKTFKTILLIVAIAAAALLIFQVGLIVGLKKGGFSKAWGDNYYQNFVGRPGGMMQGFDSRGATGGHGVAGPILKIDNNVLTIQDRDSEKIVTITASTVIRRQQEVIKVTDLQVGDDIVVLGAPNSQGQVEAKLIRVMPFGEQPGMPVVNQNGQPTPPAINNSLLK